MYSNLSELINMQGLVIGNLKMHGGSTVHLEGTNTIGNSVMEKGAKLTLEADEDNGVTTIG